MAETTFTESQLADIRQRLVDWKELNKLSWNDAGLRVSVPGSTLSLFISGKYSRDPNDGPNQKVAIKAMRFFESEEQQRALDDLLPTRPTFIPTKLSAEIFGVCRYAQRNPVVDVDGNLGGIVGEAGIGKTKALRAYRDQTPNVVMVTLSPTSKSVTAMLKLITKETGSRAKLGHEVRAMVRGRRGLLIIDEAQHAEDSALEELRSIADDTGVGVVLSGNPLVLRRAAKFAQLDSRITMRKEFKGPYAEDVDALLDAWQVEDGEQRRFLHAIAAGKGALRRMVRVLELATSSWNGPVDFGALRAAAKQLSPYGLQEAA